MKIKFIGFLLCTSCVVFVFSRVNAQTNSQNVFVSAVDQDLNIKTVVMTATTDNVSGIYAKPVDEYLRTLINEDKQWSLSQNPLEGKIKSELLDENPDEVKKILKAAGAEALLTSQLVKGPRGLSITLNFFVGKDGQPLIQENLSEYKGFDLVDVKIEVKRLYEQLKAKMPFKATILSRRGQQVTLSLGSAYGLKPGNHVSVVQILKINRHPKLKFMVSSEKEVLGRVQLFKVEPYLSFGNIVLEKEAGVIDVGAKILPEEYIKYPTPVVSPSGRILQDLSQRPDKDVAFGDSAEEWIPEAPPQFGKIEVLAGFSNYTQNASLVTAGSVSGSNNFAPNIAVRGEMWINPEWYVGFGLRQAVYALDNGLSGSTPGKLNGSFSQYGVNVGYNFLLQNDFFGPKLQINGGYVSSTFAIDDSTPTAFTKMQYGGLVVGFAGQFPISEEMPLDIGAKFDLYLSPSLSEGKSSGSSTNTINSFGFFGEYKLRQKFKLRGELLFDYYDSDFSGSGERTDPATSTSHKLTTLMAGVQWLF